MEGTIGGLGYDANAVTVAVDGRQVRLEATVAEPGGERNEPDVVALVRFGRTAGWEFDLTDTVR
jgi:hypothetical protein